MKSDFHQIQTMSCGGSPLERKLKRGADLAAKKNRHSYTITITERAAGFAQARHAAGQ